NTRNVSGVDRLELLAPSRFALGRLLGQDLTARILHLAPHPRYIAVEISAEAARDRLAGILLDHFFRRYRQRIEFLLRHENHGGRGAELSLEVIARHLAEAERLEGRPRRDRAIGSAALERLIDFGAGDRERRAAERRHHLALDPAEGDELQPFEIVDRSDRTRKMDTRLRESDQHQ